MILMCLCKMINNHSYEHLQNRKSMKDLLFHSLLKQSMIDRYIFYSAAF